MAKALILHRSSGTFARFLVPLDLRSRMGQRFLVRRLPAADADGVRLVAATMGYALGHAFWRMRIDGMTDHKTLIKDVLEAAKRGAIMEYIIQGPNGFMLRVDDADDHARAMEALPVILKSMAPASAAAPALSAAVNQPKKLHQCSMLPLSCS